jgi:hypothetical protein
MGKWKRWAIGVVAALLAAAAFLLTAAPGGAAVRFARGYWGPYKNLSSHRVDTGKEGLTIADRDTGTVRLYKHGKQRGVLYFDCAYTIVRKQRVRQLCQGLTDIYAHGQIVAEGVAHTSSFRDPITGSKFVLHITGGSGDYRRHPRGTVTVNFHKKGVRVVYRVRW